MIPVRDESCCIADIQPGPWSRALWQPVISCVCVWEKSFHKLSYAWVWKHLLVEAMQPLPSYRLQNYWASCDACRSSGWEELLRAVCGGLCMGKAPKKLLVSLCTSAVVHFNLQQWLSEQVNVPSDSLMNWFDRLSLWIRAWVMLRDSQPQHGRFRSCVLY